jgi:competence protein ComEC
LDSILPQEKETEVDSQGGAFTEEDITTIKGSDVSIHFLMLGNEYTGDCTLIKVGDTEVLIDAGSRQNSAATIVPYVNQFCTDGVLEYVIATHADQDHIAAFPSSAKIDGIFESFECKTIIDFAKTNKTTQVYQDYVAARNAEVEAGATHYTALECYNQTNGAQRSYTLGEGITMNFLYQKYYEETTTDENDYSVCMLLSEGDNHYLFTGDLEEHGEASLVEKNELPKCKLFKGGHHGSKTSSTDALLKEIQPDIVCVCCCAGSDEYKAKPENTFPTQAFVDRVAQYTKNVYVTTLANDTEIGYEPMNGNIVVMANDGGISVRCSNNATLLKDTEWFKNNRTTPSAWTD